MALMQISFSAYGKLPSSREFVWRNCDSMSAAAFKGWLDGAAGVLPAVKGLRQVDYALHVGDGKGRIVGSLWPSTDAGGLRPYLLALFSEDEGSSPAVPFRSVWNKCAKLHDALRGARDERELFRELELLDSVSLEDSTATPAIPLQVWVDDVLHGDLDQMALALWRWRSTVARDELDEPSRRSVLRIPLSARMDIAEQADSFMASWPRMDGLVLRGGDRDYLHLIAGRAVPADLMASPTFKGLRFQNLLDPTLPSQLEGFAGFLQQLRGTARNLTLRSLSHSAAPQRT